MRCWRERSQFWDFSSSTLRGTQWTRTGRWGWSTLRKTSRPALVSWKCLWKYENTIINSTGTALHYFCAINFVEGVEALLQVINQNKCKSALVSSNPIWLRSLSSVTQTQRTETRSHLCLSPPRRTTLRWWTSSWVPGPTQTARTHFRGWLPSIWSSASITPRGGCPHVRWHFSFYCNILQHPDFRPSRAWWPLEPTHVWWMLEERLRLTLSSRSKTSRWWPASSTTSARRTWTSRWLEIRDRCHCSSFECWRTPLEIPCCTMWLLPWMKKQSSR